MRVLVTGSAGFIGRHLTELLARRGHLVAGLDIGQGAHPATLARAYPCDLLDAEATRRAFHDFRPELVCHLAAVTDIHGAALGEYAPNVAGVDNLLEAIRHTPSVRRAICTSTQLVCRVGFVPSHDQDYAPSTVYGESKVRTEQIWRARDGAGREWCIVRPTTIWGPGMSPHYLTFFALLRRGRYVHVGREPIRKTYGFVGNTVYQYAQLADATPDAIHGRTLYLADYEPIELHQWAEAFRRKLGARPIRTVPRFVARAVGRAGDVINRVGYPRFPFNSFRLHNVLSSSVLDVSGTARVCGPLPFTTCDGVGLTAEWLRAIWAGAEPHLTLPTRGPGAPLSRPTAAGRWGVR